jgi:hypothetical protein
VVSAGAETFAYAIGGGSAVTIGAGGGEAIDTQTADWVHHDPARPVTLAGGGGPATQRVPLVPAAGQAVEIWVKVGYEFDVDRGFIYYTTDGSEPQGAFGAGTGTTATAALSFSGEDAVDSSVDWWKGALPAQTSGTVRYKIALFDSGIAAPISDADPAKLYGQTRFAVTNFSPRNARVWLHNNLNTNHTAVGLRDGFHVVRARALLPRSGKASVFNTFTQTFYYISDTDGDGLPDSWETEHGLAPDDPTGPNGPDGDPDMDDFSNLAEYLAGTDPRDAESLLRILPLANGGRVVTWTSVPSRRYRVYSAADPAFDFEPLSGPITATGAHTSHTNPPPAAPKEFYRVRVVP